LNEGSAYACPATQQHPLMRAARHHAPLQRMASLGCKCHGWANNCSARRQKLLFSTEGLSEPNKGAWCSDLDEHACIVLMHFGPARFGPPLCTCAPHSTARSPHCMQQALKTEMVCGGGGRATALATPT